MKYALVEGNKTEPSPGIKGTCACCGSQVISKCGKYKIWHWAHQSSKSCDPWWENETVWHRQWKNYFPVEFQEVIHVDEITGEKHIADIKTTNDMVIEFQNSSINPNEVISREGFYGKMLWVVNGANPETLDKGNLNASLATGYTLLSKAPLTIKFNWYSRSKLFERWSESKVTVFFDFGGDSLYWLKSYEKNAKEVEVRIIYKKNLVEKNGGSYKELSDRSE